MCKISELKSCERRVTLILESGRRYSSEWFIDEFDEKLEGKVNCTKKEYEIFKRLLSDYDFKESQVVNWYISRKHDDNTVYISDHAMVRLRKRNGWSKKAALRMVRRVYDEGTPASDLIGPLSSWVKSKVRSRNDDDRYVVYGTSLYVFNNNTLITTYPVPYSACSAK